MRVLVVGGAGYVGGAVTDRLLQTEHDFRVYDALLYEETYRKDVPFVRGDVLDDDALRPHLRWADAVIWLAALVGDGACSLNPEISEAINHEAVRKLVQAFDGRVIFTSTCSVYGAQDKVLTEEAPTIPLSLYGITKLAAESELKASDAMTFRLGTLFGASDLFSRIRLDLVVNTLTAKACTAGRISVYGGRQYRPLLHVRDAAEAIVAALTSDATGLFNLHAVNMSIGELAETMQRHFPSLEVTFTDIRVQDTRNYRVSSDKARRLLQQTPTRNVDDGINEIRALIEEGRLTNVDNPRYTNHAYLAQYRTHLPQPAHAIAD